MEEIKEKPKKKFKYILIPFIALFLTLLLFIYYKFFNLKEDLILFKEIWMIGYTKFGMLFPFMILGITIISIFVLILFKKLSNKNKEFVSKSIPIIFFRFWIPSMVIILFLLGSIHGTYQYESTFENDLNKTSGIVGGTFYKIYEIGEESPRQWFIFSLIAISGFLYFTIGDLRDLKKEINLETKNAQELIDEIKQPKHLNTLKTKLNKEE